MAGLRDDWNRLAGDVPFRRWEWLECWWRHYRPRRGELCVLAVRDRATQQLVGLAPLYIDRTFCGGPVLSLLGSGHVASDYLTLLALPEHAQATAEAVALWLAARPRLWQRMELTGIAQGDVAIEHLVASLQSAGMTAHQTSLMNLWPLALPITWDAMLKRLSSSRRYKIRKMFRDLLDSGRGVLVQASTPEELKRGFAILCDLHQQRRQSKGDAGCFASEKFVAFHREVMLLLLAANQLRLIWIEVDGRPVAVNYSVAGANTMYLYQTGFDPRAGELHPGWVVQGSILRLAIEAGCSCYDFLRGDEDYKASWGATPVPLLEIRIVSRRPLARLRHQAWQATRSARQWLKRYLRPAPATPPTGISKLPEPSPADSPRAEPQPELVSR